ncbi:MAG: AsmA-like C-terminal region-containing protein, partial [Marinirhabdus sp.]|nr:AsmA-like C-terminal region-containing protein [Marinirhabdus sp.]
MKKALKITGIILGILLLLLFFAPYLFKGTFEDLLRKNINKNLNAEVSWESMDLSLYRSFPKAAVVVHNFKVINKAPFEGDTLAMGEQVKLNMGITQLFKSSGDPIIIDGLDIENTTVNIQVDSLGRANYDLAVKSDAPMVDENATPAEKGFVFNLKRYAISNSKLTYADLPNETFFDLKEINHEGKGDFSLDISNLETTTTALMSLKVGDIQYLNDNSIGLDANFEMDLPNQKYTFLENEAKVNELPLTFEGFVQVNEENTEMDLSFKTPSSDFKNFLAVIPKTYVQELDGVTTTGDFTVNGMLKGVVDDDRIPTMNIKVRSNNASFKYPDLPKAVRNITINADVVNETGIAEDTYLTIGNLTFTIDNEPFAANGSIRNLSGNAIVNLDLKGTLNLAHIDQVLPLKNDPPLRGIFTADVNTYFDMASVENEQYQNIKTNGTASLRDFTYTDTNFKNPINIGNAAISMSPGTITLNRMTATTGETDIDATGSIQNLIPWIMAKQDLKGTFNVQSNTFNLNDFSSKDAPEDTENPPTSNSAGNQRTAATNSGIKIPDFLDATLNFTANKVIYDDITLDDAKGSVRIQNETASLENVTSSLFGGNLALSGNVSTKNATPTFAMDLDLNKIDISSSFEQLDLLSFLAPIARALEGDLNTSIKLNGNLGPDFTPIISSIAGNALAQIITAEVNQSESPL